MYNLRAVFEEYTEFDIDIAKKAKEFKLYLIGGTAIDLWCNYHNMQSWRSRSNNDIDFWSSSDNFSNIDSFTSLMSESEYLEFKMKEDSNYMKSMQSDKITTDIDILIDFDSSHSKFCQEINGIGIMHPIYLFASKFDRYLNSTNQIRKETDVKDLKILLKIIEKMNDFDYLEEHLSNQSYDKKAEDKLNDIIASIL